MAASAAPINFRPLAGTRLYRSSQPDDVTTSRVFHNAGICTILDLRDSIEIINQQGCADFKLCQVLPPKTLGGAMEVKPISVKKGAKAAPSPRTGVYAGVHAMMTLVSYPQLLKEGKLWQQICIGFAFIIDCIFGSHFAATLVIRWIANREGTDSLLWLYKHTVDRHGKRINNALRVLTDPAHVPAVVICAMGKDRTGILCMLIGHICGHTRDKLIRDYALSHEEFQYQPDHPLIWKVKRLKLPESYLHAYPETMSQLLEHIDSRYGSVDGYLKSIGFGPEYQEMLRRNVAA